MISRRILRIKILQSVYSHFQSDKEYGESEKELMLSIDKTYDLFFYLILLLIDIRDYARNRIDLALEKKRPTKEDLNPNTRFVDNLVIKQLTNNKQVSDYLSNRKLSWVNYPEMIKGIYMNVSGSEEFLKYMEESELSYESDKKMVISILNKYIAADESLDQNLEEQSIFWNSEFDFVTSFLVKVIRQLKKEDSTEKQLIEVNTDKEDIEFVKKLFRKTILNYSQHEELIDEFTTNWDIERIAFMDKLIMQMAINEIIEFPSIPKRVSFNEYIDIAKFFSTQNSGQFINGILDKIVSKLDNEKKIVKQGRGLVGE
jgi:N utilization substance protein B